MDKHLQLQARSKVDEHTTERVVSLEFTEKDILQWALGLCLLEQELIGTLAISAWGGGIELRLRRSRSRTGAPLRSEWSSNRLVIELSNTELERWLHFFLSYVRDGSADVDHLDVETQALGRERGTTLVLKVPNAAPPLSADEAKRRLGI